jgi:hypothetical protein
MPARATAIVLTVPHQDPALQSMMVSHDTMIEVLVDCTGIASVGHVLTASGNAARMALSNRASGNG